MSVTAPAVEDRSWADEALEDYALTGSRLDGNLTDLLAEAGRSS
jgi:hypothetical protein